MLNLDRHITLTQKVASAANLTSAFDDDDLAKIGNHVKEGYLRDLDSRSVWFRRTRAAMELAMQVKPQKSFPWPNASNVAFPLLTIAALQFHSRAYPSLFSGPEIVKYRVSGADATGDLTERARIVSRYMSYQALTEDEPFEEQHDRLLMAVPIVGCGFIKTRRDAARYCNRSEYVPAEDLVVDYFAKSIDTAHRKTQHVTLYRNQVYERCMRGTFRNILEEPWYTGAQAPVPAQSTAERDRLIGQHPPQGEVSVLLFLEQHTWLDLDGDGYEEPYIVTIESNSSQVVRLVARWEHEDDIERNRTKVISITSSEYYTKYGLIPSPDGSIYDLGFGGLLGPLNESVDTIVNQLIDAGTLATTAGGFLSRGVKMKGGEMAFRPFQWNTVESMGDDLRKGIFPLPVREPSGVLFNLLSLLINYTQRISGNTDVMTGENPGQNTPAHNMQAMVEQGQKIYADTFKRMWRSMSQEMRKLYLLNGRHLPERFMFGTQQMGRELFLADPSQLVPTADPNLVSDSMRSQQSVMIKQSAQTTPGYNLEAVERNFLAAHHVDQIDLLYPGAEKIPPGKSEKITLKEMDLAAKKMELDATKEQFAIQLMEDRRLNDAKIVQLQAQAEKLLADAEDEDAKHELAMLEAQIGAVQGVNDTINQRLTLMLKGKESDASEQGDGGRVAGSSGDAGLPTVPVIAPPGTDGGMVDRAGV